MALMRRRLRRHWRHMWSQRLRSMAVDLWTLDREGLIAKRRPGGGGARLRLRLWPSAMDLAAMGLPPLVWNRRVLERRLRNDCAGLEPRLAQSGLPMPDLVLDQMAVPLGLILRRGARVGRRRSRLTSLLGALGVRSLVMRTQVLRGWLLQVLALSVRRLAALDLRSLSRHLGGLAMRGRALALQGIGARLRQSV